VDTTFIDSEAVRSSPGQLVNLYESYAILPTMYIFFVLVVHKTAPNLVLSLSEIKCPRAPFFFCYADDLAAVVTAGHCDELRIKGSSTLRTIRAWMAMNDL
jgi:hypothetical protein